MKNKTVLSRCGKLLLTVLGLGFWVGPAMAQVSVAGQSAVSQNFNALPSDGTLNWANNSTISGWYAGPVTAGASASGLQNFGPASGTNRSLGGITNTTNNGFYYGYRLKNNSGDVLRNFQVTYTLRVWSKGTGNPDLDFPLNFTSGTSVTDLYAGTWTTVPTALTFFKPGGGPAGAVDGLTQFVTKSIIINGVELQNGQEIMFRWTDPNDANNSFHISIDDVSVLPFGTFYNLSGNAATLANWKSNKDGSGTTATAFTANYQTFKVVGSQTLNADWVVSGTNSKLVVGDGINGAEFIIPNGKTYTGVVDVANYGKLTVNSASIPTLGTLDEFSTVDFNSPVASQTVPVADYANLFVGNTNKKLIANTLVRKNLKLNNARLELDNNDLILDADATVIGADANSFIVTKGNGRLKRQVKNDNVPVVFPVGTDSYMPVTIKQNTPGTTDYFSVKAIDGVYDNYINNSPDVVTQLFDKGIGKTWIIDEENGGGSDVEVSIQWNRGDELTGFDPNKARLSHFENGAWDNPTPVAITYVNDVATITRSGISSFSPFTVDSRNPAPLPVELISFTATFENKAVVCNWQTALELNNNYFTVERSLNGKDFSAVGAVKGKGTTSEISAYRFADSKPLSGTSFYRLRQTDLDGTTSFSKMVAVQSEGIKNDVAFDIYPNPAAGIRFLKTNTDLKTPVAVTITNVQGQVITRQNIEAQALLAGFPIDLSAQPKGIYFITVQTGKEVFALRALQQ